MQCDILIKLEAAKHTHTISQFLGNESKEWWIWNLNHHLPQVEK